MKNPGRGKSEKTNFWNSSFNFGKHLHPQESSSQGMKMKPVVDEMFPEGAGSFLELEDGGNLVDLTANEKFVHGDFFNNFDDLLDEDDLD